MTLQRLLPYRTLLIGGAVLGCESGQRTDPAFKPLIRSPAHAVGAGPVIWIDEGHNNIVATTGRYRPFVASLAADGYGSRIGSDLVKFLRRQELSGI